MGGALWKDTLREIRHSINRFISILIIIALGVGFFVGIKCASPSMLKTADDYFQTHDLMDFKLQSTVGFDDEDLQAIADMEHIAEIMPSYSADVILQQENKNATVKVMGIQPDDSSYTELNKPVVIEGRMPQAANECVVDHSQAVNESITIGSTVQFAPTVGEQPLSEILNRDTYTVVGIVESPMFITADRGQSTVGDGTIYCFFMIPQENFAYESYTEVYVQTDMSKEGISAFSDEYKNAMKEIETQLDELGSERVQNFEQTTLKDAREELAQAKSDYEEGQKEAQTQLDDAKQQLEDGRVQLEQGQSELEEGEKQLEIGDATAAAGFASAEFQLNSAKQQLDSGWSALAQSKEQLAQSEQTINDGKAQIADGERQLQDAWNQYYDGKAQLEQAEQMLGQASSQLTQIKQDYESLVASGELKNPEKQLEFARMASASLTDFIHLLQNNQGNADIITMLQSLKSEIDNRIQKAEEEIAQGKPLSPLITDTELALIQMMMPALFQQAETALNDAAVQLEQSKAQLEQGKAELDRQQALLDSKKQELASGEAQLEQGKQALAEAEQTLNESQAQYTAGIEALRRQKEQYEIQRANGVAELESGRAELEQARIDLEEGQKEYDKAVEETNQTLADAKAQIDDAQEQLDSFDELKWYVFSRDDNPGYGDYESDTQRVDAVASVFPVFFIAVVILVTLTTMTRMVEDQRIQIGTLKALGYSSKAITGKYFIYSFLAGIIGCTVGLVVGIFLFPSLIYMAYGAMYPALPDLIYSVPWLYPFLAIIAAILCTSFVSILACYNSLRVQPAILMRPKAPKPGKRILLERVSFIWKHLSFTSKVTARNLFRYKIRFLMTILGVAGCTALIIAALGLNDSVSVIGQKQFVDITHYNTTLVFNKEKSAEEAGTIKSYLNENEYTKQNIFVSMQSAVTHNADDSVTMDTYLVVPESTEDFSSYIELKNRVSKEELQMSNDGVIITEKISMKLGLNVGDHVTFRVDDKEYQAPITGITENYAYHYIYMPPAVYEQVFGEPVTYTNAFAIVPDLDDTVKSEIADDLLERDDIMALSYNDTIIDQFNNTISSMQAIVVVIVLTAGALAFVVLYNLTNINIEERVREIATIKVLGFNMKETISYVFRENIILTLLGIAIGLGLGTIMTDFVVNIIELDLVMFGRGVSWISYVGSVLITLVFAILVMVVMSFKVRKIDMIESLKSNE